MFELKPATLQPHLTQTRPGASTIITRHHQPRISLPSFRLCAAPPDSTDDDGDQKLQDTLVSMIRLEVGKKQVEEYVEEGSDKLKQMAEEAKEEFDRLAELSKARADLAFDSALADLNAEAAEFEAQLKASREELTASEQDFDQWENDLAVNRSEGQFFQSLYQKDKKRPAGADAAQLQARARKVVEPARQEIGSPLRFYLFLFLVAILGADVGADLLTEEPSAGPDVLYTLLAVLAGWLAINERRMME